MIEVGFLSISTPNLLSLGFVFFPSRFLFLFCQCLSMSRVLLDLGRTGSRFLIRR